MGFNGLIGAVMKVKKITTVTIDKKLFTNWEYDEPIVVGPVDEIDGLNMIEGYNL